MDASNVKSSPFPSANDVPLHRNPPLAPSQEMAYRNKCIQLKRRLTEIENNNDATRKRISTERERLSKMRLLRAILLQQVKDVMESPGKRIDKQRLEELGITEDVKASFKIKSNEGLLDDSSDESDEDDIPEPGERPTRTRRTNNNYRESIMSTNANNPAQYQTTGLPQLAPANSFSPAAARNAVALPLTSSFHVASTPVAAESPPQSYGTGHYVAEQRYSQHSSPVQHHQSLYHESTPNGVPRSPVMQPIRPKPPVEQFREHMRPQLIADHYPTEQIEHRIDQEWLKLSPENRGLWEQRYEDQMMEYQSQMDQYNRARRREQAETGAPRGFTNLTPR